MFGGRTENRCAAAGQGRYRIQPAVYPPSSRLLARICPGNTALLGLHFIIWEIMNVKLLEFTVVRIVQTFPVKWMLIVFCVLLLAGSAVISFSLPYCIAEGKRIRTGLKIAAVRIRRRPGAYVAGVLALQGVTLALTAAVYLLSALVGVAGIMLFIKPSARISGVLIYGLQAQRFVAVLRICRNFTGFDERGNRLLSGQGKEKSEASRRFFRRRLAVRLLTLLVVAAELGVVGIRPFTSDGFIIRCWILFCDSPSRRGKYGAGKYHERHGVRGGNDGGLCGD